MKLSLIAAAAAIAALCATSVMAQQDPIAARKALMKLNGQHAGAMSKMAKGETPFDAAVVKAAFAQWADTAAKFPSLFPDSSKTGDTRALPAIWTERAKFDAAIAKFAADVKENEAKATNVEGLKVALGAVGKNCGGCHETFRAPR
jgi:cytochrome c556